MYPLTTISVVHIYADSGSSINVVMNNGHTGFLPPKKGVTEVINAIRSVGVALIALCKWLCRMISE